MKQIRILRKVIHHGPIYAKQGDVLTIGDGAGQVPAALAEQWVKAKKAEAVK